MVNIRIDFGRSFSFFDFSPYKFNPLNKKTEPNVMIFSGKKGRKKYLQNRQPSSQSVRNRLGNNICFHFRASNRPLDGVEVKKWSKPRFWGVWARFWTLNFPEKSEESSSRVNISEVARSNGKFCTWYNFQKKWPKNSGIGPTSFSQNQWAQSTPEKGGDFQGCMLRSYP